jgi:nucleoid-associated protein YgaU
MTTTNLGLFGFLTVATAAVVVPQTQFAADALNSFKNWANPAVEQSDVATLEQSTPADMPSDADKSQTDVAALEPKSEMLDDITPEVQQNLESAVAEEDAAPTPKLAFDAVTPKIDLLRVEPDGNTLISGVAEANAEVLLKSGETVVGTAKADAQGNFVVLTDQFLPKGDYQFRLETKGADGESVVVGEQTVVISIPEKGRENELLAVVTTNDGPSLIVEKPQPEQEIEVAAATPMAAEVEKPEAPEMAASSEESAMDDQSVEAVAANDQEPIIPESSVAETDAIVEDAPDRAIANVEPSAVPTAETNAEETLVAAVEPESQTTLQSDASDVSSAANTPIATSSEPEASAQIEAIETEADRLFIAGAGTPRARMRIYMDNEFIGTAQVGRGDRFLFEKRMEIAPGDHKVRIDVLEPGGDTVVSRAEVPFQRGDDSSLQASIVTPLDDVSELAAMANSGGEAVLSDATEPSGDPKLSFNVEGGEVEDTGALAANANAGLDTNNTAELGAPAQAEPDQSAVPTETFAVSEQKNAPVIIRRGDSLWRISRRVYGQGIRYTTIYLANRNQIRDPDKIYPGQIFDLPEDEESETVQN